MKKLLALVLALVMTLGLATVSSSAALSDFSDASDVNYEEAMAVMNAVGVFVGDNGKLAPKDNLTRAAAAKIIAYLNLGATAADSLSKDVTAFTDVPAGNWATGYITYCYNAGIIAGDGTGKFYPNNTVTGLEFAKMLLVTLGYDAQREGLVGSDYALNTTKLAATNDLFAENEGLSVNVPATREEAALYAFNALKAPTYAYATASTTIKGADGLEVLIGGSNAAPVTIGTNIAALGDGAVLQLGEKLYKGDLTLNSASTDDMNRPADRWTYKNVTVGTYGNSADLTFVVKRTNKTFAELVKAENGDLTFASASAAIVSINGEDTYTAIDAATNIATGPYVGDVVEVYLSSTTTNQVSRIVVTRYSAAKVTGAIQTKTTDGVDYVRVPGVVNAYTETKYVKGYEGLAKGDVVYFYQNVESPNEIYLTKAEKITGSVTAYAAATTSAGMKFTIDGTKYEVNESVAAVTGLTTNYTTPNVSYNTKYDFYQDANGYIIYGIAVEDEVSDYVVVQAINSIKASGVATSGAVEARLVKMDGTTEVVKVSSVKINGTEYKDVKGGTESGTEHYLAYSDGNTMETDVGAIANTRFFTYSVDSDGNYKLTSVDASASDKRTVGDDTGLTITNKSAVITGLCSVNNSTVFVVAKSDNGKTFDVYTGKDAVPSMGTASAAFVAKEGIATYVYVNSFASKTTSGGEILFLSATPVGFHTDKDGSTTYTYNEYRAVIDGEITTVKVAASAIDTVTATGSVAVGTLVSPTYDKYGVATVLGACTEDQAVGYGYNYANGSLYVADGNAASYSCSDSTVLFYKDEDGNYVKGTFADYASDDNDAIYVVVKSNDAGVVDYAYVQNVDDDDLTVAGVYYGTTASVAGTSNTFGAATSGTYAKTGLSDGTYSVRVDVNGLLGVKFSATNSGWSSVAVDADAIYTFGSALTTGSQTVYFRVVAVDGTESATYTVTLTHT